MIESRVVPPECKCVSQHCLSIIKIEMIHTHLIIRLCRLAEKVLLRARDEVLSGDEEQAYVLYMRFIDIFQCIRSSKTYKTEKRELDKILSPGKASKALDEAEKLSRSLKERFEMLLTRFAIG